MEAITRVFIVDIPYGNGRAESASQRFRRELQKKYSCRFSELVLGRGADLPVFVTDVILTLPAAAVAVFFSGKLIRDNIQAWYEMGKELSKFSSEIAFFDRVGAFLLALKESIYIERKKPSAIRLISYQALDDRMPLKDQISTNSDKIDNEVKDEMIDDTAHYFRFLMDEKEMVVLVRQSDVIVDPDLDSMS